jgi:predicted permease
MSLLRSIRDGLRGLFRRHIVEAELDDEVNDYLARATRERIRGGMTPESAARAARLELGSVAAVKEEARSGGWEAKVESAWNDFRYAVRSLRRNPGFTLVALLTLALGVGATTAIFSGVNAVILRPLPFRDPGRLALLWTDDVQRGLHEVETSFPTFRDWQTQARTFAELAVFSFDNTVTLLGGEEPERTTSSFVSARLFPLLGVEPVLGRGITAEDEQRRERVVVLSYGLWQRRFGGRRDVVGKALSLDGDRTASKGGPRSARIIGVMPAGFFFPGTGTQLWEPVTTYWRLERESGDRFFNNWRVVGRLAPGTSFSAAQIDMDAIGRRLAQAYPSPDPDFPGFGVTVVPMLDQVTGKNLQLALWVLLGAVGLVLLIACVNLASLQLARGAARGRELAVRVSLGAGRLRLLRQLLTESLTLAGIGGAAGLAIAAAAVRALAASAPPGIARIDGMRMDGTVLAFTVCVSILAGILFGIVPAWKLSRSDPNDALKTGGLGASGTSGR